jgi:hypothetical protein
MSGSGESSASAGRDEFGFDLASDDDEVEDLDVDDEDFDDDDLDDDEDDGLIDEDALIDLDDEYDESGEAGKPHPGHRYDD